MQAIRRIVTHIRNKPFQKCNLTTTASRNLAGLKHANVAIATPLFNQISKTAPVYRYLSTPAAEEELIDSATFEKVCEETLDSLCEYFESIVDKATHLNDADVSYGNGVLTVKFGKSSGTYVINRQSPNRQIWLSSPTSGPKRYDYIKEGSYWIYKHDGQKLHQLLEAEIPLIVKQETNFSNCLHSGLKS